MNTFPRTVNLRVSRHGAGALSTHGRCVKCAVHPELRGCRAIKIFRTCPVACPEIEDWWFTDMTAPVNWKRSSLRLPGGAVASHVSLAFPKES
jgi:hypothetical protein